MFFQSANHLHLSTITVNAPVLQPEFWDMIMKYLSQWEDGIKTLDSNM